MQTHSKKKEEGNSMNFNIKKKKGNQTQKNRTGQETFGN